MSTWTATNIQYTKRKLSIFSPQGMPTDRISGTYTADIKKDGTLHHVIPDTPAANELAVSPLLLAHLADAANTEAVPDVTVVDIDDITLAPPSDPRPVAVITTFLATDQNDVRSCFLDSEAIGIRVELQDPVSHQIISNFPNTLFPVAVDLVDPDGKLVQRGVLSVGVQFVSGTYAAAVGTLPMGYYNVGPQTSTIVRVQPYTIAVVKQLSPLP